MPEVAGPVFPYYDELDAARGVLMALGIVIHAANIYALGVADQVGNPDQAPGFYYVGEVVHLFRMPAFFFISGFFCAMSLRKQGVAAYVRQRAVRLLVPMASAAVTLNAAALFIFAQASPDDRARPIIDSWGALVGFLAGFNWLLHLWFLPVLFAFAGIAALLHRWSKAPRIALSPALARIDPLVFAPLLALSAYLPYVLGELSPRLAFTPAFGGLTLFQTLIYAPYFIVGYYFHGAPAFERLRTYSSAKAVLFVAVALIWPLELMNHLIPEKLEVGFMALGSWVAVFTIFPVFVGLVDRLRLDARLMARPAYTVYLAHFLFVAILAALLVRTDFPMLVEFLLIVFLTLAGTLALHFWIVERIPVLSFLFNGRPAAAAPRTESARG